MIVTGIIAEFNPFHNGHKYLLDQVEGLKIVALSGNFVQRGEPAFVDKWTRAQMALENGADLVVELPFLVSVQAADHFAEGAVAILAKLGITQLAFGTEAVLDYGRISQIYGEKKEQMEEFLKTLPDSLSYPQKTQEMWKEFAGLDFSGETPNHILALAYAKAVAGREIALCPIERQGAGFHSLDQSQAYASATALRQEADNPAFLEKFSVAHDLISRAPKVSWDQYFPYLRYQILTHPDLTEVFQVNQELAIRLKEAIQQSGSVEDLVDKVATKRYTKARVRRILTYILVQAREEKLPESIHVLGFTDRGRQHLATVKGQVSLVSRIGKEPWDRLTQQADSIYQLGNQKIAEQVWGRTPIGAQTSH